MRTNETISLPNVANDFDFVNEELFRRSVEQVLQDMRNDMIAIRDTSEKSASMANRRRQFLLMGA
jgi:hypothetical protein